MRQLFIIVCCLMIGLPVGISNADAPPAIITFSFIETIDDLSVIDAELGRRSTTLEWMTTPLREGDTILLQQLILDDWQTLNDEDDPSLSEIDEFSFRIEHSLTFSPPTYRLIIQDEAEEIVSQRVLTLDYHVEDESPSILSFSAEPLNDNSSGSTRRQTEYTVEWDVANRTPMSHIAFKQVMPNDELVDIEQTRESLWVSSSGTGIVQSVSVNAPELVFRMMLTDLSSGAILDSRDVIIAVPLVEVPTQVPNVSRSDTVINSFSATPTDITFETPVTFNWDVSGDYDHATLFWWPDGIGSLIEIDTPVDSYEYQIPVNTFPDMHIITLSVYDANGALLDSFDTTIRVSCPYEWAFGDLNNCATSPVLESEAAYQAFQYGFMIWYPEREQDIWVFQNNGSVSSYIDVWDGSDYVIDSPIPPGTSAPERGFGYLWATNATVRNGLGGALDSEESYTINVQIALLPGGLTPPTVNFFTLPDGQVIEIYFGDGYPIWQYVE